MNTLYSDKLVDWKAKLSEWRRTERRAGSVEWNVHFPYQAPVCTIFSVHLVPVARGWLDIIAARRTEGHRCAFYRAFMTQLYAAELFRFAACRLRLALVYCCRLLNDIVS